MIRLITIYLLLIVTISCSRSQEQKDYNPKAIEINNKAIDLMKRMEYDSALLLFDKAIEIDKNYYLPHSNKAGIYLSKKDYNNAMIESEMIIKKKPDLAEGWSYAGMMQEWNGDSLKAKVYYKKSIELFDIRISNPKNTNELISNRLNRAFALILLGEEKKGKEELEKLKTENPDKLYLDDIIKMNKKEYLKNIFEE